MKTNVITRIIVYSLLIVFLVGLLLTCLGVGAFMFNLGFGTDEYNTGSGTVSATDIRNLDIDWAAGSVTITTAETDHITFTESGNFSDDYAMIFNAKNGTLSVEYSKPSVWIGFGSTPSKDLTITVPEDWDCDSLEIDGAALNISITGLSVDTIELDGASMKLSFNGSFDKLDCDGASCKLNLVTSQKPHEIDIDGASCHVDVTLPYGCGFLAQMEGLGSDFDADVEYSRGNGSYSYGDRYCQINMDGLSCSLRIH